MLSCELISADCRLTQSAEMVFWAVHHVEAESTCQADSIHWGHECLIWYNNIGITFSCELSSADDGLTQSAEMIFWAVHHVEAESACQIDSVLVTVSV